MTDLDALKARNSCAEVARRLGAELRQHGREWIGPCVVCSSDLKSRTASRWQTKGEAWVCAVCQDGGDVVRLVERALACDFKAAVEWLGGETDGQATRAKQPDRAKQQERSEQYRERERKLLLEMWSRALPPWGTPVEVYLRSRHLPLISSVRYAPLMPYFHGQTYDELGRRSPVMIHRGPAMIAPLTRGFADLIGTSFTGLHITYLAPDGVGKLKLRSEAGDMLPAKKVRGSKAGSVIQLIRNEPTERLVIGEGIETVLSVYDSLVQNGVDLDRTAFWSSIDLGNLGGRAIDKITHPNLTTARGRPQRVPGYHPDFAEPGIEVPFAVTHITILGDGDSDRLTTECAVTRAAARFHHQGVRNIRVAWAPDGQDFNDLLTAEAAAGVKS